MYNNVPTKVLTGEVRLSYANLVQPRANNNDPNAEPKYSVTLLIPKTDEAVYQNILASIEAAAADAQSKIWNGVRPPVMPMELVEQLHGQHALVFYNFQHDRDRLLEALVPTGLRVRVYSQAQDEKDWNNGEIDILLAHPASCGYGLNLQRGGHHAIWFGLTWSLEQYEQANKRLHRQGQEHPVVIHHLIAQGGMDETVIEALQSKGDMQGALMDALRVRISKIRS